MSISTLAPAPTRASGSVVLTFGMTSIPLAVYTGTDDLRIARREFVRGTDVEVGRAQVRRDTGAVVDGVDVVKMAQASNGTWVELTDDEMAEATLPKGTAEVVSFVPNAERGKYVTQDVRQVRPQGVKGRVLPAVARSFGLLLAAMEDRDVCALVRFVQRGPARYALLTSDGFLFLVFPSDHVREALPISDQSYSAAELALAGSLIEAVGIEAPVLLDQTAHQVQAVVDGKAAGVTPTVVEQAKPVIIDLVAQLQASIDAVNAAKAEAPKPAARKRTKKVA